MGWGEIGPDLTVRVIILTELSRAISFSSVVLHYHCNLYMHCSWSDYLGLTLYLI